MTSPWLELVLISLASMVAPGTIAFSMAALLLGTRPLRTGAWFYLGGVLCMIAIGVAAAFVLGNAAAPQGKSPREWVSVFDVVAAALVAIVVLRWLRKPSSHHLMESALPRMQSVASSPAIAILGAGAMLAIPGAFIPLALKAISQTDPSDAEYVVEWTIFTLVAMLPLGFALLLLALRPAWAKAKLALAQAWLGRNLRTIAALLGFVVAAKLLHNGIAGLT